MGKPANEQTGGVLSQKYTKQQHIDRLKQFMAESVAMEDEWKQLNESGTLDAMQSLEPDKYKAYYDKCTHIAEQIDFHSRKLEEKAPDALKQLGFVTSHTSERGKHGENKETTT